MGERKPQPRSRALRRLARRLRSLLRHPSGSRTSIRAVVADVRGEARFRWILRSSLQGALVVHPLFIVLLAALGAWPLAVVNVGSVLACLLSLRSLRRGSHQPALAITAFGVTANAVLATIILGLSSGFFIYLPLLTVLTFLQPNTGRTAKVVRGAAEAVAFLGLIALGEALGPIMHLAPITLAVLAVLNAFLFLSSLGFLIYVTQEATQGAERDLRAALARLDELARTDALTGLFNRRAMSELLDAEAQRVARHHRPFAVLVADLDDFKGINDAHGHPVGDLALRSVAQRLLGAVRAQDRVARWGGEEFLLLLPETDRDTGLQVAERLRQAVSEPPLEFDGAEISATATFGVAVYEAGSTIHDTIRSADRALYAGKDRGKDRVVGG